MNPIDFTPLRKADKASIEGGSVDITSIKNSLQPHARDKLITLGIIWSGIFYFLVSVVGVEQPLGNIGFKVFIYGSFGLLFYAVWKQVKLKEVVWQNFAKANGWEIITEPPEGSIPSSIATLGRPKKITSAIKPNLEKSEFYCYVCAFAAAGNSKDIRVNTVLSAKIEKPVSGFLVESRKVTHLKPDLSHKEYKEKLKLEGNFSDYFNVYIQEAGQISVLSILTPDVMQLLINIAADYSFEIYNGQMNIIAPQDQRSTILLPKLFEIGPKLLEQINQNIH